MHVPPHLLFGVIADSLPDAAAAARTVTRRTSEIDGMSLATRLFASLE